MKTAIEMISIVVAITLGCVVITSLISTSNQVASARDFYNVIVNRIEDSNCNSIVIEECKEEATAKGYELLIEDVTIYEEEPSKLVIMNYVVDLPIFKMFGYIYEKQAVIEGYAR